MRQVCYCGLNGFTRVATKPQAEAWGESELEADLLFTIHYLLFFT